MENKELATKKEEKTSESKVNSMYYFKKFMKSGQVWHYVIMPFMDIQTIGKASIIDKQHF